ncbi:hypothetical protein A2U01_0058754, partial [Trifolium medium]|nr:hypothetical protein [Trifolium medium]
SSNRRRNDSIIRLLRSRRDNNTISRPRTRLHLRMNLGNTSLGLRTFANGISRIRRATPKGTTTFLLRREELRILATSPFLFLLAPLLVTDSTTINWASRSTAASG